MKNTKYKLGDKVQIKSREWFEKNIEHTRDNGYDNICYDIFGTNLSFNKKMFEYCGKSFKIVKVDLWCKEEIYTLNTNDIWCWSEKMIFSAKELRKRKIKKLNGL
jgi:hypothetical protein